MTGLSIGMIARQVGVAPSALRYYEKAGLLPAPARSSTQRRYEPQIIGRIRIILLARAAGFSVSETKTFLSGFQLGATPAARWRALAQQKLSELDALIDRVAEMKALLEASFRCDCRRLEDCERLIAAKNPLQRLRSKRRSMQRQHS